MAPNPTPTPTPTVAPLPKSSRQYMEEKLMRLNLLDGAKPAAPSPPKSSRQYMEEKLRRLNLLDGAKSATRGVIMTPTVVAETSGVKGNAGMDKAQRPYSPPNPLTKEDIERIKNNKPQNFNAGQKGDLEGFIVCIWGCGAQIKRGVQFTSNHNRYKNMYQLAHKPSCPQMRGHNRYLKEYHAHWDDQPRETQTPAIRESYHGTNKTKVGFEYGRGAFVLRERKVRKHPENKYKRKTDEEQKKKQ